MKYIFYGKRRRVLFLAITAAFFFPLQSSAQATYTLANYAANADTFYLTSAQPGIYNFDTTGQDITWNYVTLTGISQRQLEYRLPTQTGFNAAQWPYLYNANNVNLSSTDGQTISIGGIEQTNPNDYFLKENATSFFSEKASSYTISLNNHPVSIKNVYTAADTVYKFPLQYGNVSSSHSAYTISIPPGLYYRKVILNREDTINGWGTVITPYATFSACLKYVSTVMQVDSIAVNGKPVITNDTTVYREINWFDPLTKYPVLTVRENKIAGVYITQTIEYYDAKQYFQPLALFVYYPVSPNIGDTVTFQNLSTNAYNYQWTFGDGSSVSNEINPQHIFSTAGTYRIRLVAINGPLSDTTFLSMVVNPVNTTYTFTGDGNWSLATNWSNNIIPPSTLTATNTIIINPVNGGSCVLDTTQKVLSGAALTVRSGKKLILPGNLNIQ